MQNHQIEFSPTNGFPIYCSQEIIQKYKELFYISKMYVWQMEAIQQLLTGYIVHGNDNLLFSAPTMAGKSLVSEMLLLYFLLQKFHIILICSTEQRAANKAQLLQNLFAEAFTIQHFQDTSTLYDWKSNSQVTTMTISKALECIVAPQFSSITSVQYFFIEDVHIPLLQQFQISSKQTTLRMDQQLETLLPLLLHFNYKLVTWCNSNHCHSTIVSLLGQWLHIQSYQSDWKPFHCKELLCFHQKLVDSKGMIHGVVQSSNQTNLILQLCWDSLANCQSPVAIIYNSLSKAQTIAQQLATKLVTTIDLQKQQIRWQSLPLPWEQCYISSINQEASIRCGILVLSHIEKKWIPWLQQQLHNGNLAVILFASIECYETALLYFSFKVALVESNLQYMGYIKATHKIVLLCNNEIEYQWAQEVLTQHKECYKEVELHSLLEQQQYLLDFLFFVMSHLQEQSALFIMGHTLLFQKLEMQNIQTSYKQCISILHQHQLITPQLQLLPLANFIKQRHFPLSLVLRWKQNIEQQVHQFNMKNNSWLLNLILEGLQQYQYITESKVLELLLSQLQSNSLRLHEEFSALEQPLHFLQKALEILQELYPQQLCWMMYCILHFISSKLEYISNRNKSPPPVTGNQSRSASKRSIRSEEAEDNSVVVRVKRKKGVAEVKTVATPMIQNSFDFESFFKEVIEWKIFSIILHTSTTTPPKRNGISVKEITTIHSVSLCGSTKESDDLIEHYKTYSHVPFETNHLTLWKQLLENKSTIKICYDAKQLLIQLFQTYQIEFCGIIMDIMILFWMHDPEHTKQDLSSIAKQLLPQLNITDCDTSALLVQIYFVLHPLLQQCDLMEPYLQLEMKIIPLLAQMELIGIQYDLSYANSMLQLVRQKREELENKVKSIALHELGSQQFNTEQFDIRSTDQVSELLFSKLQCPIPSNARESKRKNLKMDPQAKRVLTNKEVLKEIHHPIAALIIEFRNLDSLFNNWWTQEYVHFTDEKSEEWKIGYHWQQTSCSTGRLATYNPNMQNIPQKRTLLLEGNEQEYEINMRRAFVPSKGYLFLSADYSQIELRMMAHFSQDKLLQELLTSKEVDVFSNIAAELFSKEESQITNKDRDFAKRLIYSLMYGMGVYELQRTLELPSVEEAKIVMQKLKSRFTTLKQFLDSFAKQVKQQDCTVVTIAKRKRKLIDLMNKDDKVRSKAERTALSTLCQGSAADLIKQAMILINEELQKECKEESIARMVLQIHDELLFEVKEGYLNQVAKIIQHCMEHTGFDLHITTPVKLKYGTNWGNLETLY